jgi:hypothetical protein
MVSKGLVNSEARSRYAECWVMVSEGDAYIVKHVSVDLGSHHVDLPGAGPEFITEGLAVSIATCRL